ncbi:MAG: hypothetical protein AVDCRST_MAG86-4168 [uncultured Truepera sp.]|uniref:histidine kinase n=1 Tax=uncultured Truepera sp. TaxID=543023 RepID=A0A6J4VT62_9DEIN|nr:MAG: hypothetical protein AVDCRST_MAG86-4168 [uncultured Truepera sp.]
MNRLATRLTLVIVGVALLTTLLALLQGYLFERQAQELPTAVRDPLMAITDGLEQERTPESLRPQFEALIKGLTQNYEEVQALGVRFSRLRDQVLVLSIGVLVILSVGLALFLARRISGPITAVAGAAARIAEGDLSARAELPHYARRSRDETAVLAHHFNAMAAALEQLERERQALIADIAHELRTPLTILQGQLDAIQDGIVPFNQGELGKLDAQTELLSRLIDDLRTLSLADAKRLTLERVPTDLVSVARRVCDSFREKAQRQGLTLDFRSTAPHAPFTADPDRLAQVLTNLLENAVRYTPSGGWVGVSVKTLSGGLKLSVEDTGPGLSHEAQARVFERFYRAETSRGRAGGGSGLGLAIVRTLVELHGGRVEAHNRAAGGAAFHVTLPQVQDAQTLIKMGS